MALPGRGPAPLPRPRPLFPFPPQKCLRFNPDATIWTAKQQVLCALSESLQDVLNYGLFQPATSGRDANFLEEERLLREYPQSFEKGVPYLEVRPRPSPAETSWWADSSVPPHAPDPPLARAAHNQLEIGEPPPKGIKVSEAKPCWESIS